MSTDTRPLSASERELLKQIVRWTRSMDSHGKPVPVAVESGTILRLLADLERAEAALRAAERLDHHVWLLECGICTFATCCEGSRLESDAVNLRTAALSGEQAG